MEMSDDWMGITGSSLTKGHDGSEEMWSHGVMVSTQDSESCNPSSNLGGTFLFLSPFSFCLTLLLSPLFISPTFHFSPNFTSASLIFVFLLTTLLSSLQSLSIQRSLKMDSQVQ